MQVLKKFLENYNKKLCKVFFPFDKADFLHDTYIRQNLTDGPSIIFTRYAKTTENCRIDSRNICNTVIGIDASQLYPYSTMKDMPTGPYLIWEYSNGSKKDHRQLMVLT